MRRPLLAIIFLFLTVALGRAVMLEGRVVRDNNSLAGMIISAHKTIDPGSAIVAQTVSGADGLYKLEIPEGRYSIFARHPEQGLFAFFGRNPVEIRDGVTPWVGLQAVPVARIGVDPYDDPYSAALGGVVFYNGKPLSGAIVTLYLDTSEDLKGQGYRMSLPTGDDGSFFFDGLPEADYHLVARRHADGSRVGPVQDGDDLGLFPGNPLHVAAGKMTTVTVPAVRKVRDAGLATSSSDHGLVLTGMIVDSKGKPQAGLHVFAYRDKVIGHKRPEALSPPTGADGSFHIAFPDAGTYYVGAREKYGDSPAPGELFGLYEVTADHGLQVSKQVKNEPVKIVVEPITLN